MKSTGTFLKLAVAVTMALAVQTGWAQSPNGPLGPVASAAAAAARFGTPLPVVPASSLLAGQYRPHVWVARALGLQASPSVSLPSFCNKLSGSNYIFCPNGLQTAYGMSQIVGGNGGLGITIAIVDAYHYGAAESDLNTFNTAMGLPLCTSASGCFAQVSQTGGTPVAAGDSGWELETMLDLEYAHAMAPKAKLLLVEGTTNSFSNLTIALNYAAAHADIVSNSYGSGEFASETDASMDGQLPAGKTLLFSSGDAGAPAQYPCASSKVTCVGGTSLTVSAAFQRTLETGWADSGGGCSLYVGPQAWQSYVGATTTRCTPDIAADADPATGVAVLDTGNGGYFLVGGTSLATPLMAGLFADVMTARLSFGQSKFGFMNTTLYNAAHRNYAYYYYDVTLGNNGNPAGAGYDLVTGLGVSKTPAMANRFFGLIP